MNKVLAYQQMQNSFGVREARILKAYIDAVIQEDYATKPETIEQWERLSGA